MSDPTAGNKQPGVSGGAPQPPQPGQGPDKPKDDSLSDAKSVSIDFGKDLGGALWKAFREKASLKDAIFSAFEPGLKDGSKDAAKSGIDALRKQAAADPASPLNDELRLAGDQYFSMLERDLYDELHIGNKKSFEQILGYDLTGKNAVDESLRPRTVPAEGDATSDPGDGKKDGDKSKSGFDYSIGFPKVNASLKTSWLDLASKGPSPKVIKEMTLGEKIELKYHSKFVDVHGSVSGDGSLGLDKVDKWTQIGHRVLVRQGQGSASAEGGIDVKPTDYVKLSLSAGVDVSDKLDPTQPGGRKSELNGHVGLRIDIAIDGSDEARKKREKLYEGEKKREKETAPETPEERRKRLEEERGMDQLKKWGILHEPELPKPR